MAFSTKKLREERAELREKAQAIVQTAEADGRGLNAEETEAFKKIHADDVELQNRIKNLEDLNAWESDLKKPESQLDVFDIGGGQGSLGGDDDEDAPLDVWALGGDGAALMDQAVGSWCKAHVHGGLEAEEFNALKRCGINAGQKELFIKTLNTSDLQAFHAEALAAGLKTGVPGTGGVLTKPSFMKALEFAMLKYGGILQVAEIIRTTSGEEMGWPTIDDTSNRGSYVGEGKSVSSNEELSTGDITWRAYKGTSKFLKVPTEMFEDEAFNVALVVARMIGERLGRWLNYEATMGAAGKITGVIPWIESDTNLEVRTSAATTLKRADLLKLKHAVDEAYRSNARWMVNDDAVLHMKQMTGDNNELLWHTNTKEGEPDRFDGDPIQYNRDMGFSLTANSTNVVYGDLSYIKVRQVRGVRLKRLTERFADEDVEGFGAFMRADSKVLDAGTHPIKGLRQKSS